MLRKGDEAASRVIPVTHGEPIRFGPAGDDGLGTYAVVQDGFRLRVAKADEIDPAQVVVHDAANHELAFALSRLSDQDLTHTVTGIFRNVDRTTYDDAARAQVQQAVDSAQARGGGDLAALLRGRDTWTVVG